MNYTIGVDEVDQAALLIALGYELQDYTITTTIDLNQTEAQKRHKSASWQFSDHSRGCKDYGTAQQVIEGYKLPTKGKPISNTLQAAKLAAHNYQVLKSVILRGEPLEQIEGDGYFMLKNANGVAIPKSDTVQGSTDLASIAIAAALGCRIVAYSLYAGRLSVEMVAAHNGITLSEVEQEKDKDNPDTDNYNLLPTLVAAFLNRQELMSGIYARQQVVLTRGSKQAIFSANADEKLKKRILKELNA